MCMSLSRRGLLCAAGLAGGAALLPKGIQAAPVSTPEPDGICDLHIHAAPDTKARSIDELSFCQEAKRLGYRAVLFKSNDWSCHDRAFLIRKALPDFQCFGSFCMNRCVGDRVNVYAAESALKTSGHLCKCIWMPTLDATYPKRLAGHPDEGIPVVDDHGAVLPEVIRCMELCAEADILFATGHASPEESLTMARKAHEIGLKKFAVTHVNSRIWRMTHDQIHRVVDLGGFVELCCLPRLWGEGSAMPTYERENLEEFVAYASLVPERTFLSTDLGQAGMPSPAEGMRQCISDLLTAGLSQHTIDQLTRINPAYLLGIQ